MTKIVLAAAFLSAFSTQPFAQTNRAYRDFARSSRPYSAQAAHRTQEFRCVKLCSTDNNPCDPAYFKDADGRCTGE